MWKQIKSWLGGKVEDHFEDAPARDAPCHFKWYDVGSDNPFPVRVLDVRSLTWNVVATTGDPKVAETFLAHRLSDGRHLIDAEIANSTTMECNLIFPHNGAKLEGVVCKADSMDVKWDIYFYSSAFLFARSWTGQLHYRALAEITDSEIRICSIETLTDQI